MTKLATVFGGAMLALVGVFFMRILSAIMGGVSAWIVGCVFGDIILRFFAHFGITGYSMFQLGIILGFVGSYLITNTTVKPEKHEK